jgi:hypothetical protein
MSKDTDFQVPPIQQHLLLAVDIDGAVPLLISKREIDDIGQILTAVLLMLHQKGQGSSHRLILGRRTDIEKMHQPEERPAMAEIKLPEEREVIVPVVRGEFLGLLQQPLDASLFLFKHLSHLLAESGIICDLLGLEKQAADQRLPFGKRDLLQFRDVQDPGLRCEMLDLRTWDAVEQALYPGERFDPHEVIEHVLQVRERCTLGNGFEPLEFRVTSGDVAGEQERV